MPASPAPPASSPAAKPAQVRRRGMLRAAAVTLLWLVVAMVAAPLAGKLTGIQTDTNAAFLPHDADATKVLAVQQRIDGDQTVPAVIVWERPGGVTAADRALVSAARDRFAGVDGVVGDPSPVVASTDGAALQVVVQVAEPKPADAAATVDRLRAAAPAAPGLSVHIAGAAALDADFASVLESVDGTLLAVTGVVVIVVLVLVYRSPVLWIAPLASVGVALVAAQAILYLLAKHAGLSVDAQSASILSVLAFGAGTDYALLLIARYREELAAHGERATAVRAALRGAGPAIAASGLTVSASMLCLLASQLTSNRSLGVVAAIGIACTVVTTLTFLPALLLLAGRWLLWPANRRPATAARRGHRMWERVADAVDRRHRLAAAGVVVVLGALSFGMLDLRADGISQTDAFTHHVPSATAQQVLSRHFPAGAGSPALVVTTATAADRVTAAAEHVPGVTDAQVLPSAGARAEGLAEVAATLADPPDSEAALATVDRLRTAVAAVPGAEALVGGESAILLDLQNASARDRDVVIPIVLVVVFLILAVLLRALVAPVAVIATVVLSFLATLGASALVFDHVFHFAGADPAFPLFAFVFLVALGVDYNIFLMTRVREEAARHGTRRGAREGLVATGGVITSAGLVLAATFAALGVLPLVFFATIGFAVAFGVLLDTLLVRSVLVPALTIALDRFTWWPGGLAANGGTATRRSASGSPHRDGPVHTGRSSIGLARVGHDERPSS